MKILLEKHSMMRIICTITILMINFIIIQAQDQKITVKLLSKEPLLLPKGAIRRIIIRHDEQKLIGYLIREANKRLLSIPNRPQIELPYPLEVFVSLDGKTVLQFGDSLRLAHPERTDLYWINEGGEAIAQVVNHFSGDARLNISDDGFTAISGSLFGKPESRSLALFSPLGKRLWEKSLNSKRRIDQILVSPQGNFIITIATDREKWLENHRLEIWNKSGAHETAIDELGILQKFVILGSGKKVFIQGYDAYGIVDIPSRRLLWKRPGKIRMISPYGAVLSPDKTTLILLLAEFEGRRTGIYRWKILALNASTGEEFAHFYLPEQYPSTWERVFEKVTAREIKILAGKQRISYSWHKQNGEKK